MNAPRCNLSPSLPAQVVPYPPRAALPEVVPKRPAPNAVWVDGEWRYTAARDWMWQRGRWVRAVDGQCYQPSRLDFTADGMILYAEGKWVDSASGEVVLPPALAPAGYPPDQLVPEEATP